MSTQRSQNHKRQEKNSAWLDRLINELAKDNQKKFED